MLEAANGSALHASRNFAVAPPVLPQGLAPVKYAFAISRGGFLLSQKTVSVRIPRITPAGVTSDIRLSPKSELRTPKGVGAATRLHFSVCVSGLSSADSAHRR